MKFVQEAFCMATHRGGEIGLPQPAAPNKPISYGFALGMSTPATNFSEQQASAFEFGELEEALVPKFLQGVGARHDGSREPLFTSNRPPTIDIFPSRPMRFKQTAPQQGSTPSGDSTGSESGQNTFSCNIDAQLEPHSSMSCKIGSEKQVEMASDGTRAGPPQSDHQAKAKDKRNGADGTKIPDAKTLRRLAQNREAARKSRLRKKAYIQQLESSRIKLSQLEQELHRARSQGLFVGAAGANANISSGATMFDMEYARWVEENGRHMAKLRAALHADVHDGNLRVITDGCLAHYDDIFRLKGAAAKADVFHLITGMWKSPAERCFLWMGGFRPSELIKVLLPQLDPFTEQQLMGICTLQRSSQQAEEALSQGYDQLRQSLVDTVAGGSPGDGTHVGDYMSQMVLALGKLSNLEGFVRQADNLRQQTLHQMHQILTVRQAARCFLAIGEYFSRLRALSSLWATRPRENLMAVPDESSCQTTIDVQSLPSSQTHFDYHKYSVN